VRCRSVREAHVEALSSTIEDLGGTPVEPASYEFPYSNLEEFVKLSARIEAVGTSAYAGAGPFIDDQDVVAAALSIHSVEARHTSYFSSLLPGSSMPNAFDPARSMDQVGPIAGKFVTGPGGGDSADSGGSGGGSGAASFTATVENVSGPGTIDSERAMGAVPLSPPVYAVYSGDNPAFTVGESASEGTEIVTEDGFPMVLAQTLAGAENVSASDVAPSPGGSLETPALGPGESVEFEFSAAPGDHFTMETMFVQSNDWFYGFEGLALFDGNEPVSGDVTGEIGVYDAGTEADTAPGTGPDQKPVQDPEAMDVGPAEDEPIRLAAERHPDFTIPADEDVIRVTITPA
jgi:hypothetical protein